MGVVCVCALEGPATADRFAEEMVLLVGAIGVQGLLPLIPAEVSGVKLQEPITTWWNELFATPGNCEKCSLTVLYTLIEFMCLMAVPTVVGALLVLFAAFAPGAADTAIAIMEEKVGSVPRLASPSAPVRAVLCPANCGHSLELENAHGACRPAAGDTRRVQDPASGPKAYRWASGLPPLLILAADGARDRPVLPAAALHHHGRLRRPQHH